MHESTRKNLKGIALAARYKQQGRVRQQRKMVLINHALPPKATHQGARLDLKEGQALEVC
jgi:hypothetical protein